MNQQSVYSNIFALQHSRSQGKDIDNILTKTPLLERLDELLATTSTSPALMQQDAVRID